MRTKLRGLDGILTGDLAAPRIDTSAIAFEDGRIVEIGEPGQADVVVDAHGARAMPGLWDGAAALYFGDHEPQFSARGAIAAAVQFGTTALVGSGRVPVTGWIGDPRSNRELAVLTVKSWRFDRPRGIKVFPGVIDADPSWTRVDLEDLASVGASTILISTGHLRESAATLAAGARAAGLRVGVTYETGSEPRLTVADIVALEPDVVLLATGHAAPTRELLADTRASIGVTLARGLPSATDTICGAAERGALGRIFLGTGLPGRSAVLPGGMALFMEALAATTGLGREQLVALATANVARAFGCDGGTLALEQPADIVLVDADRGAVIPWSTPVRASYIDGTLAWSREATA